MGGNRISCRLRGLRVGFAAGMLPMLSAGCTFEADRRFQGDGGVPDWARDLSSLRVEPLDVTVSIVNGAPATQAFRAIGTFRGGRTEDVTTKVGWTSGHVGMAVVGADGVATTGTAFGGQVAVSAAAAGLVGRGFLNIRIESSLPDPTAMPPPPPDPGGKLGGRPDPARAPQLVYPNDGVLLPPNLFRIEVHFRPGPAANTLFEIGFANALTDVRVYTRCRTLSNGCVFEPTREVWTQIAQTNRGGQPVKLTVRATDDAGSAVGTSATQDILFSEDIIRGALYYWTTSQGSGIMRWNFGDSTQTQAERVVGTQFSGGTCVGCHAISRDGKKMILSAGGQRDGRLLLFDVVRRNPMQPFPLAQRSQFESWNPDGTSFVGVYGDGNESNLLLFDGSTGARTGTIDVMGRQAGHPDWSQDGARITFTDVGEKHTDQRPGRGAIADVEWNGSAWSAPRTLVPRADGVNRYYPAGSPDNTFVVYNESTCPSGRNYDRLCNADTDPTAKMWAIRTRATPGSPVELKRGNAPGVADNSATELTSSFPKWSPFVFVLSEQRKLLWLTVSSSRQYGLRRPPAGGSENPSGTLVWMIGVEPGKLINGGDPSYPAFCLPFQDLATSNHIAQWTSDVPIIP